MKESQRRYSRSYKSTERIYKAAQRQAKKDKTKLSQQIEKWIDLYGKGYRIIAIPPYKQPDSDLI